MSQSQTLLQATFATTPLVYLGSKITRDISKVKREGQETNTWNGSCKLQLHQMVGFLWNSLFKILPPVNVTAAFAPEKGE